MQPHKGTSSFLRATLFACVACVVFVCCLLLSKGSHWYILPSGFGNKVQLTSALYGPGESTVHKSLVFPTLDTKDRRQPTSNPTSRCSQEQESIILVITYIDERDFSSIPLLHHLYKKDFANIVYCLPKAPKFGKNFPIPTVIHEMNHGLQPYGCLIEVIRRYQNATGYLYLRDNAILNVWNLRYLSRAKIWESSSKLFTEMMFQEVRDISWIWWSTIWGMPACEASYIDINRVNSGIKNLLSAYNRTSFDATSAMNCLLWNGKGSVKCYRRSSSIFYLPRAYAAKFASVSDVFFQQKTFSDIAIPTILRMVELEENFEIIRGVDLVDIYGESAPEQDESLFWRHYNSDVVYTAPLTLRSNSSSQNQRQNEAMLLNHIMKMRERKCSDNI